MDEDPAAISEIPEGAGAVSEVRRNAGVLVIGAIPMLADAMCRIYCMLSSGWDVVDGARSRHRRFDGPSVKIIKLATVDRSHPKDRNGCCEVRSPRRQLPGAFRQQPLRPILISDPDS